MLTWMPLSWNWRGQLSSSPLAEMGAAEGAVAVVGWPLQARAAVSAAKRNNGRVIRTLENWFAKKRFINVAAVNG